MELCFRVSILGFVFGIYISIFFLPFSLKDGKTLCEQNVSDCFIATYGLPKSCVMCTGGLNKRMGGEGTENAESSCLLPTALNATP